MDATIRQCRYLLKEAETILTGLDDSHRALEPKPGTKTSGWLIGHLAVTGESARASFPTAGDFAGYLMAGHLAYHLGQVSAWRAAAGLRAKGDA